MVRPCLKNKTIKNNKKFLQQNHDLPFILDRRLKHREGEKLTQMGFAQKEPGSECTYHFPVATNYQVKANSDSKNNDFHKPLILPNHMFSIKHNLGPLISISPPSHICALQTSLAAHQLILKTTIDPSNEARETTLKCQGN